MAQVDDFLAEMLPRLQGAYRALCEKLELVAAGACGDLAYTVAFEHKTVDTPSGGRATYTLRTIHVFRREDGEWRTVHRHGDRPPERDDFPIPPAPRSGADVGELT